MSKRWLGRGRPFSWSRDCKILHRGAVSWRTEDQPGCIGSQWTSDLVLAATRSIISALLRLILDLTSPGAGPRISLFSTYSICFTENVKIKHGMGFVSKRLIFWDGLRNTSTLLSLESKTGCLCLSALVSSMLASTTGRNRQWYDNHHGFWDLFICFSYRPLQFKFQRKTSSSNVVSRISICIQALRV